LENITSCENKYASNIVFAIISVVSFILGYLIGTEISIGIGFFLFMFFAIIYALTKQNNIIVGSPSPRMKIDVKGMKREIILEFIDLVEETKHNRI
jgi:hypothetical protein